MNQLREKAASLRSDVKWLLAAAYALDGNRKVAEELISLCGDNAGKANPYDGTYNSDERRMSISLMTLTILGRREEAFRTALKMSDILKKDRWLSTQSTAWMLSTLSNFAVAGQNGIDATAGRELVKTDKSIASMPLARVIPPARARKPKLRTASGSTCVTRIWTVRPSTRPRSGYRPIFTPS